jgi:hypothetical protein
MCRKRHAGLNKLREIFVFDQGETDMGFLGLLERKKCRKLVRPTKFLLVTDKPPYYGGHD